MKPKTDSPGNIVFRPYEDRDEEQIIEAWQHLHDTRLAYKLQGWFGRTAQSLIEQGVING